MVLTDDLAELVQGALVLLAAEFPDGIPVELRADLPDDLTGLLLNDEVGIGLAAGNDDVFGIEDRILFRVLVPPFVRAEIGRGVDMYPVASLPTRGAGHGIGGELVHGLLEVQGELHFIEVFGGHPFPDHVAGGVHFDEVVVVQFLVRDVLVVGELVGQNQDVALVVVKRHARDMVTDGVALELVVVVQAGTGDLAHDLVVPVHDHQVGGGGIAPDASGSSVR